MWPWRTTALLNGSAYEDTVELNDIIEWYLAAPINVRDVPELESAIPGFADALSAWLNTVTFDPQ